MANYYVTFIKKEKYEIEANSPQEAEDMALSLFEDDTYAFLKNPPDEIIVEKKGQYSKGIFTLMVNPDGTPQLYNE